MIESITLELSLKPFKKTDSEYINKVCREIFEQYRPLLKGRRTVSLMLWVGDGSELLDYDGDESEKFEWCRFVGTANLPYLKDGEPRETSLHHRKQDYIEDPPEMTYAVLKRIISSLKAAARAAFPEATVEVGETFDIGPEFAISDFKYNRHREICSGFSLDKFGFVDATAQLQRDERKYAAYQKGIPEGTPFGKFLGRQAEVFLRDMGFDFLWLSNGLGFSDNPWNSSGKIYDGAHFYPERLERCRNNIFSFWKLFREECTFPLKTRGTNRSAGIDYACDGVPLYDIYKAGLGITAPPNSPWAALNDDYGLELMGHMTRICELPSGVFPFRYYLHDPWWINSPWYDRYDGSPCDIYLPMMISRINREGGVESANALNILSIDNSYGDMPELCASECIPHLLRAEKHLPDAPSPFVWVYPLREYTTATDVSILREMKLGDEYVRDAINDGFPLSCVVSADSLSAHPSSLYRASVLISAVPIEQGHLDALLRLVREGVGVIVYGTGEALATLPIDAGFVTLNTEEENKMREAVKRFGYSLDFYKRSPGAKPPTLGISRDNNGFFFSVYNANTTTEASIRTPLGAPVLCGIDTEIKDGASLYRFGRGEGRECRVFVEMEDGVIVCREAAPVNVRYRRAISIRGLRNATVRLFPERGCEAIASTERFCDQIPERDGRFTEVCDEKYGRYLLGKNVSGDIFFRIGHKNTADN